MSGQNGGADPAERVHARVIGDPIQLDDGGVVGEFEAHIRYLADGSMALDGLTVDETLPPMAIGQPLKMSRAVAGDATYVWTAHVTETINPSTGSVRLGVGGAPERIQQREHVRVNTQAFKVTLRPVVDLAASEAGEDEDDLADGAFDVAEEATEGDDDGACSAALRDVSAGGMRLILDERIEDRSFSVAQKVHVTATLTSGTDDPLDVDLDAVVRWAGDVEGHQMLGLEFVGVNRRVESQLTRWVFAEEARQSRMTRR